jgi:outer membrane protein
MHSRRTFFVSGKLLAGLVVLGLLSGVAAAQRTDYSKPRSHLFNFVAPYTPVTVPPPNFANAPRIDQLLKDGKLMLSMDDAIALALENNLDMAIARYNLSIADTDVLRTKAGASARGVNTGVVQGTPGGGGSGTTGASGGGAGGTSTGAGGAGAGTGGIVSSTLGGGPTIPSFDPTLSSTMQIEHSTTAIANPVLTGNVPFSQSNTGLANFTYLQGFATGTNFQLTFNNNRQSTNSTRSFFNPLLNSSFRAAVQQHLLQGFGYALNKRQIIITKNNREITDIAFRQQIISTVNQIQDIYWDLVNAYEDVRVKQRSLGLAQQLLSDTEKQVQIGTLAPIEIVRAQSAVATANQDLIVSQTNLQLQQLYMKNAVSKNLSDPALSAAEVIPTDTMEIPKVEPITPTADLVNDALAHRPELASSRIDLTNRSINKKAYRNALLPTLDLVAFYGTSALAGPQNPLLPLCSTGSVPCVNPGEVLAPNTGYGNAFTSLFSANYPDYGVGLTIQIPIRNRAAQADQIRSELEYQQAQMRLQQLQNQIRIEVRNAQFALQQNRARVEAAQAAVTYANQSLDAEQKKYLLGASTNYAVLQAQRDLAQAESNLVAARAAYEKSRVELDRSTGATLTHLGIQISDAETGQVKTLPHVPGVVPRNESNPPAPSNSVTPQVLNNAMPAQPAPAAETKVPPELQ